jgi:hypothetical protein
MEFMVLIASTIFISIITFIVSYLMIKVEDYLFNNLLPKNKYDKLVTEHCCKNSYKIIKNSEAIDMFNYQNVHWFEEKRYSFEEEYFIYDYKMKTTYIFQNYEEYKKFHHFIYHIVHRLYGPG